MRALDELVVAYEAAQRDPAFQNELADLLRNYVGRPSPLYHARPAEREMRRRKSIFKREDLNHTGRAQDQQHASGRRCLTVRMGKRRVIAETGAGQHGVATATACARFGLRLRRLHGRGGHPPAEAQRVQHAD